LEGNTFLGKGVAEEKIIAALPKQTVTYLKGEKTWVP
jgi:hypothetical protein